MVKQGRIIKINFDPRKGHEQAGLWPAVVISNNFFNKKTGLAIVCPITTTNNHFPLHIELDERTKTQGVILCEHVRTLDIESRTYLDVEDLPKDLLKQILSVVSAEIN